MRKTRFQTGRKKVRWGLLVGLCKLLENHWAGEWYWEWQKACFAALARCTALRLPNCQSHWKFLDNQKLLSNSLQHFIIECHDSSQSFIIPSAKCTFVLSNIFYARQSHIPSSNQTVANKFRFDAEKVHLNFSFSGNVLAPLQKSLSKTFISFFSCCFFGWKRLSMAWQVIPFNFWSYFRHAVFFSIYMVSISTRLIMLKGEINVRSTSTFFIQLFRINWQVMSWVIWVMIRLSVHVWHFDVFVELNLDCETLWVIFMISRSNVCKLY